jgi:hypothetical protein
MVVTGLEVLHGQEQEEHSEYEAQNRHPVVGGRGIGGCGRLSEQTEGDDAAEHGEYPPQGERQPASHALLGRQDHREADERYR